MTQRPHGLRRPRGPMPLLRRAPLTLVLSLAVALAALPAPAGHAAGTGAPRLSAQLDTYLTALSAQGKFSGAVLVASNGVIVLSKGYALADRAHKVPNTSSTRYPVGGVSFSFSILGTLWLEEHSQLPDQARICTYISGCPPAWQPMTVHMVLDGTSNLPNYDWGNPGMRPSESLANLQLQPLDGPPGSKIDYQNGDVLVLATIIEQRSREPWASFLQHTIFGPAGMTHSGRMTDDLIPRVAQPYSGTGAGVQASYGDYFAAYSSARDIYAYDNALFGGRLLSPKMLARLFAPRATIAPTAPTADAGISDLRYCYYWKTGGVFGHQALYTSYGTGSFFTVNMRFPREGVTIVVNSNDDTNQVERIAVHLAGIRFGR